MKLESETKDKTTIRDVARMAGVSIKTVSRVTNNQPNVREQTRIRVQNAINKLDYSANPYASYLGSLRAQSHTKPSVPLTNAASVPAKSQVQDVDWW